MQNVVPIGVRRETQWLEIGVTSAWGGAGELVTNTTDSTSVTLRNIGAWPIEYRIDAGAWTRLELRNSIQLDVSMATTAIRLRKSEFGGDSIAQLEIKHLTAEYVADGRVVQLGGGGATSFTDLVDVPETITPLATLRGDASGQGIEFVTSVAPFSVGAARLTPSAPQNTWLQQDPVTCTDSPLMSFSFWIKLRNAAGTVKLWSAQNGNTFAEFWGTKLGMNIAGTDGVSLMEFVADDPMTQGEWHHMLGSFQTATEEGAAVLYIDGVRVDVTFTNYPDVFPYPIALSGHDFVIGGDDLDLAEFWWTLGQTLLVDGDIPVATRLKFRDADGWPVSLGANGITPTGTAPTFFLRVASGANANTFQTNLGASGGSFSVGHGGVAAALTSPTDVPDPFVNPMSDENDLIIGGVAGYPERLAAPPTSGTFALRSVNGVLTWVAV